MECGSLIPKPRENSVPAVQKKLAKVCNTEKKIMGQAKWKNRPFPSPRVQDLGERERESGRALGLIFCKMQLYPSSSWLEERHLRMVQLKWLSTITVPCRKISSHSAFTDAPPHSHSKPSFMERNRNLPLPVIANSPHLELTVELGGICWLRALSTWWITWS